MSDQTYTEAELQAAIAAAVQEERKAIKAHIDSDAFMPSKEYDRASHRIDAWESGVCDVVEYLDSRGPASAVDAFGIVREYVEAHAGLDNEFEIRSEESIAAETRFESAFAALRALATPTRKEND